MIIDTHVHVWTYPALANARDYIKSTKDLVSFRSRCPDLYDRTLTEQPIDNSDQLISDMDEFGIDNLQNRSILASRILHGGCNQFLDDLNLRNYRVRFQM